MSIVTKRLVYRVTVGRTAGNQIEQEIDTFLVIATDAQTAMHKAITQCAEDWPNELQHGDLMVTKMSVEFIRILT